MEGLVLAENIETDNVQWTDSKEIILLPQDLELGNCSSEDEADTKSTVSVTDNEEISSKQLENNIGQLNITSCSGVHVGNQAYYHGDVTIQQYVLNSKDAVHALPGDVKGQITFIAEPNKEENKNLKSILSSVRCRHLWYIFIMVLVLIGAAVALILLLPTQNDEEWDSEMSANSSLLLYSREEWQAQPSRGKVKLLEEDPPHYVIIAHTAGVNCTSFATCSQRVRDIQYDHMGRGWNDLGMHFLVGGDGAAYTGLGWGKFGAHTLPFNRRSIAIYFIGNFMFVLPPKRQIRAAKLLIEEGIRLGKIASDYKLFAHKQVWATESPGAALIEDIKKWPHWTSYENSDELKI